MAGRVDDGHVPIVPATAPPSRLPSHR
jgi:hypothetical protein